MTDLWTQLRQRKLVQWAVAYVAFAFALLQGVDIVATRFSWPAMVEKVLILLLCIGFVLTLIVAWYHGEQGRQRVSGIELIILAVVLAVGGGFLWQFTRSTRIQTPVMGKPAMEASTTTKAAAHPVAVSAPSSTVIPAKSIAVLPFENLSGDKDQQYFSDGISEDLLNLLARIPQLQVTARTSSFWFRGKNYTIPQIAAKLHVAYILEGSVQKAGDEVRISVQLVNAATDTQRWSQTYDRKLKDVFKIQDEIGADVVKNLKVRLLGEAPEVKQVDPQAYTLYLRARKLGHENNPAALKRSDALYRRALAIDPRYAKAWVGLASNTVSKIWWATGPNMSWKQNHDQALMYARKAAAFDPHSAGAQAMLGYLAMMYRSDFGTAARHLRRALALDPENQDVLNNAGLFLFALNRPRQAMAVINRAKRLDPVNFGIYFNAAVVFEQQMRLQEAIAAEQKGIEMSPDSGTGYALIAWFEVAQGRPKAALAALQKEQRLGAKLGAAPAVYCALGRKTDAEKALKSLKKYYSRSPAAIASAYADCGDADQAFTWLDKAADLHSPLLVYTIYGVSFRNYHQDPRWKAFLRKVGYAPDQLARIKFEVNLPATPAGE